MMQFYISSTFFNCSPFSHFFRDSPSVIFPQYYLADLAFNTIIRFIEALALGINSMSIYRQLIDRVLLCYRCDVIRGWAISSNWRIETERERISPLAFISAIRFDLFLAPILRRGGEVSRPRPLFKISTKR